MCDPRYAASVVMSLTYGKMTPTSYSDSEVLAISKSTARLGNALRPGAYLVDSYPFLKHIPVFTSKLRRYHEEELALFSNQVNTVKQRMVSISARAS